MSPRALTIALIASVGVNLFAAVAATTVIVGRASVEEHVEEQRRPGRGGSYFAMLDGMEPAARERVRETLRASALASRPDFEAARQARREAVELAGAKTFDAAAVSALLQRSREAELRGRARLERDMIALLPSLSAEDRAALAPVLSRTSPGRGGKDGVNRDGRERKVEAGRMPKAS